MTKREGAIITAYTGIMCCDLPTFHTYAEEKLNRSIFTHEFSDAEVLAALKVNSKEDFISICMSQTG